MPASFEEVQPRNPAPSAGTADPDPVDVYGSALAPVGTSAPGGLRGESLNVTCDVIKIHLFPGDFLSHFSSHPSF